MKGNIFDIQRFSIHDGPGIRTTVFVKGCPLRCLWCHNPESQRPEKELMFYQNKCVGCGKCEDVCRNTFTSECTACGKCVSVCSHGAREIKGREADTEEVFNTVKRDIEFYKNSGGGVTVSGGEPLSQWKFTKELLEKCKEAEMHTAIETSGFAKWEIFQEVLQYTDLLFFDIKGIDENLHIKNTGVSNKLILENAEKVMKTNQDVIFRMPYIPGYNDTETEKIREFTKGHTLELMPYHSIGCGKYSALGKEYTLNDVAAPDNDLMQSLVEKYGVIFSEGIK